MVDGGGSVSVGVAAGGFLFVADGWWVEKYWKCWVRLVMDAGTS
jgi:hypothetical protein